MQFKCTKTELVSAINIVSKGTSKMQKTILECILFSVKDGKLTLKATDIALSIITCIDAQIEEEGEVAIPAKFLYEIINRFPESDIEFKHENENSLKVSCLNSVMNLAVMNSEDFPEFPIMEKERIIKIPQVVLKNMINQTVFSVAITDDKPILKGMLFDIKKDELSIVAVDGYRMAVRKNTIISDIEEKYVIPSRTLREIAKILSDSEENIKVSVSGNMALFNINNTQIFTRLLEGDFINYKNIIPQSYETTVKIETEMIKDSLERASIIAREGNNNVITFDIKDKVIDITTISQMGNLDEQIPIIKSGKELRIAFNAKYFLDILKNIEESEVNIYFNTQTSPCVLKSDKNNNYEYLVLPVQLNE